MVTDVTLEGIQNRFVNSDGAKVSAAACGIREIAAKHLCASRAQFVRIHVQRREGTHNGHAISCSSNRYVETAFATFHVQWAKAIQHPTVSCLAVPDRQDYRVALVTLYPL